MRSIAHIAPVKEAEEMLQKRSYLTRMFTTISPDEMVKDPTFDFTDKLPDVDQQKTAEQTIYCSEAVTRNQAPWKMVLPDGTVVWGEARNWPFTISDINNAKTAESFEMGPTDGEVVDSNEETIGGTIDKHNASADKTPPEPEDGMTSGDGTGTTGSVDTGSNDGNDAGNEGVNFERSDKGGGCGCNAAGGSAPFWLAALGLFGLVRLRRGR